jgi:hypothetical protein
MPANYVLIGEQTVSQSVGSVTLNNIPQTGYTDLKIVLSARGNLANQVTFCIMEFNGSASNLSSRILAGEGTGSPYSGAYASNILFVINGGTTTSNTFGNTEVYIPNYASNTLNKSVSIDCVTEGNSTYGAQQTVAALWANTAPITSVTFFATNGSLAKTQTFDANTTFSLYGIAALGTTPTILPKATGGDIVVNDGTYWYHAFLSSGTFIPSSNLSCSALVVAGGGGGGDWASGGGGAGGVSYISALTINASTSTTVTIGAGGAQNVAGSNSVLGSIISNGGGRGGTNNTPNAGGTGGSGGGGAINGAAGSANQGNTGGATGYGNNGGSSTSAAEPYSSAGGGGAGGVGGSVSTSPGGAGGVGITNSTINTLNAFGSATGTGQLSSGNYYYAGGGGGASSSGNGTGGLGGGGAGINNAGASATAGTINTGGGGGGNRQATGGGGAGGSGIVIVRYTMA